MNFPQSAVTAIDRMSGGIIRRSPPDSVLSHIRVGTQLRSAGGALWRRAGRRELHGDPGTPGRRPADAEGAAMVLGRPPGDVEAEAGPAGAAHAPGPEVGREPRAGVLAGQRNPPVR